MYHQKLNTTELTPCIIQCSPFGDNTTVSISSIQRAAMTPNSYFALKAPSRVEEGALTDVSCHCGSNKQKLRQR